MAMCLASVLVLVTACSGTGSDTTRPEHQLFVVATTPIIGDIVSATLGDAGHVEVLMAAGVDPHEFRPSAQQAAALRDADLVVANGLGLEEGMVDVLAAAVSDGVRILELAPGVEPILVDSSSFDPHFWMDPTRVVDSVDLIVKAVTSIPTVDLPAIDTAATTYADRLAGLDAELADMLAVIPNENRKLVTNHESLVYFAERYHFEIVGVVIPGGSTLAAPSSAELSALVETMRQENVRTIFAETSAPTGVATAVAGELSGPVEVIQLYTESFGDEESAVSDYLTMMRTNVDLIVGALS